jgi:hypothetical protein
MRRVVAVCLSVVCLSVLGIVVAANSARAADQFYIGVWKISTAVVAPWADPKQKPDSSEQARLLGKTIDLSAKRISGPSPFACSGPHYKVSNFTADLIFQGALGEMHSTNKSFDPNKIAASLGFSKPESIKSLETGCEIDFHFVDDTTAEIGLNDYVYTLKKQ